MNEITEQKPKDNSVRISHDGDLTLALFAMINMNKQIVDIAARSDEICRAIVTYLNKED